MSSTSNLENHNPQVIRQISKEVKILSTENLEGIKIHINDHDLTDLQADLDGPAGTPYAGGQFRVKLTLPKDFPTNPPKAYFLTKIFHPNVASNGEICVNTLKKDWKPDLGIKHILLTIKCLLIVPNPESALNEEAGKMLLERYDDYSQRAKLMTEIHARPSSTLVNQQKLRVYSSIFTLLCLLFYHFPGSVLPQTHFHIYPPENSLHDKYEELVECIRIN